jgi:hypothetical protein
MPTSTAGNLVFGDEAVHRLAQQLYETAQIDPEDFLDLLTEGKETPLPLFHVENGEVAEPPSWDSVERASPERLTSNQYLDFLQGKPVPTDSSLSNANFLLYKEVASDLSEFNRNWQTLASGIALVAAGSVILAGLIFFDRISPGWLAAISLVLGTFSLLGSFRIATRSRSLDRKVGKALDRARSAF